MISIRFEVLKLFKANGQSPLKDWLVVAWFLAKRQFREMIARLIGGFTAALTCRPRLRQPQNQVRRKTEHRFSSGRDNLQ